MILHTVLVSYNRRHLTEIALTSYLETVTVPHYITIVDNGSDEETVEWIRQCGVDFDLLGRNRYPGYACNRGFALAASEATHLHRADNDFKFLPGWCDEVERRFNADPKLGQLGLRTDAEELHAQFNVGGNMILRRELWDAGLRYDERPWPEIVRDVGPGYSEDSFLSPAVKEMGWHWRRVRVPYIETLASGDPSDPYYVQSAADRGIVLPS